CDADRDEAPRREVDREERGSFVEVYREGRASEPRARGLHPRSAPEQACDRGLEHVRTACELELSRRERIGWDAGCADGCKQADAVAEAQERPVIGEPTAGTDGVDRPVAVDSEHARDETMLAQDDDGVGGGNTAPRRARQHSGLDTPRCEEC